MDEIGQALKKGGVIVVYYGDGYEGYADLMVAAQYAEAESIRILRRDGGGLICLAVPKDAAENLKLPLLCDIIKHFGGTSSLLVEEKGGAGGKSPFSLAVDHRDARTGVSDKDRALTITKMDELIRRYNFPRDPKVSAFRNKAADELAANFRTPGHVFLQIEQEFIGPKGRTEIALALIRRAGLAGGMVLCELLGEGAKSLKNDFAGFARKRGLVFVDAGEI